MYIANVAECETKYSAMFARICADEEQILNQEKFLEEFRPGLGCSNPNYTVRFGRPHNKCAVMHRKRQITMTRRMCGLFEWHTIRRDDVNAQVPVEQDTDAERS